ncbi:CRISPR-associated helicase/endonuclease Cas3 [Bacillaceae bacterium]
MRLRRITNRPPGVLLAKAVPSGLREIPYAATLRGHVEQADDAARVIGENVTDDFLHSFFRQAEWTSLFRKALRLVALLHDLGKANHYFQSLVHGARKEKKQPIRHEVFSDWILRHHTGIRKAVCAILGLPDTPSSLRDWRIVALRIAILGHHLKFPPGETDVNEEICPWVTHPDFLAACRRLEEWSGIAVGKEDIPPLQARSRWLITNVKRDLEHSLRESGLGTEGNSAQGRFAILLRTMFLAADSLGSLETRSREEWERHGLPVIEQSLRGEDLTPYFLRLREQRLQGRKEDPEISAFQRQAAESASPVTIVEAGCGAGKTIASVLWAARRKAKHFFLAYPTTATATQGYADYGLAVPEVSRLLHSRSAVDLQLLGNGEEENGGAEWAGAVERIQQPLVMCTADTILGVLQNNRGSAILFPKLANGVIVFDEVHAYDDRLFEHLLAFLCAVPVPALLMSASWQPERKKRLQRALDARGIRAEWVRGPVSYESRKRYRLQVVNEFPEERFWEALQRGEKVLLVVNRVDEARERYHRLVAEASRRGVQARFFVYHSRFEYQDRVERQQEVVDAFRAEGACCAITTQICEMSFDLSADLLLSEIAALPAAIQRLGRLNRYAADGDPVKEAYFWFPESPFPYEKEALETCRRVLEELQGREISQADLANALAGCKTDAWQEDVAFAWKELLAAKDHQPLRKPGYTVECLNESYLVRERSHSPDGKPTWTSLAKHLIPMPADGLSKQAYRYRYAYVVPEDVIEYSKITGGRWKHEP